MTNFFVVIVAFSLFIQLNIMYHILLWHIYMCMFEYYTSEAFRAVVSLSNSPFFEPQHIYEKRMMNGMPRRRHTKYRCYLIIIGSYEPILRPR